MQGGGGFIDSWQGSNIRLNCRNFQYSYKIVSSGHDLTTFQQQNRRTRAWLDAFHASWCSLSVISLNISKHLCNVFYGNLTSTHWILVVYVVYLAMCQQCSVVTLLILFRISQAGISLHHAVMSGWDFPTLSLSGAHLHPLLATASYRMSLLFLAQYASNLPTIPPRSHVVIKFSSPSTQEFQVKQVFYSKSPIGGHLRSKSMLVTCTFQGDKWQLHMSLATHSGYLCSLVRGAPSSGGT